MLEENVSLKNRISDVLKNGFDKNLLEELENLHNRILKEDERIGLLRHEVAELDKLLSREFFEDGKIAKEVKVKLNKLRRNVLTAEEEFGKLKVEFNNYLLENI